MDKCQGLGDRLKKGREERETSSKRSHFTSRLDLHKHGNMRKQTDSCQRKGEGGEMWKEEEGISQRACMNDPWTWTTVWGWTVGVGSSWMAEGKGGKLGTTVIE